MLHFIPWMACITCVMLLQSIRLHADDLPANEAKSDRLAEIIEALREQEKQYSNLETVVQQTMEVSEEERPNSVISRVDETYRTVLQGDLLYIEGEEIRHRPAGTILKQRRLSMYDGEKTTSIEYGNSVNIHERRYEPSQVVPPHCWVMQHLFVNFPLSVYLQGPAAIKSHPKTRRFPPWTGTFFEFDKSDVTFVREEVIDELKCLKIRYERRGKNEPNPHTQLLWLAPERNYLCVKVKVLPLNGVEDFPASESSVKVFNEIAPGLWLPGKVEVTEYDRDAAQKLERVVTLRRRLTLEEATFNPQYPLSLFRELEVPTDLPRFVIRQDGFLKNSPLTKPKQQLDGDTFRTILTKLQEAELPYEIIEVSKKETGGDISGLYGYHSVTSSSRRTVHIGSAGFSSRLWKRRLLTNADANDDSGSADTMTTTTTGSGLLTQAQDGSVLRQHSHRESLLPKQTSTDSASIKPGAVLRSDLYRPHAFLFAAKDGIDKRLSAYLAEVKISHEGTEIIGTLKCHRLRINQIVDDREAPEKVIFLWLAEERNYIPVRAEVYQPAWNAKLPTRISEVTSWKEIDFGIWYPSRVTLFDFKMFSLDGLAENRLIPWFRSDSVIENVTLDPEVNPKLFREVNVPKGTKVMVFGKNGQYIGDYVQTETGNIDLPD